MTLLYSLSNLTVSSSTKSNSFSLVNNNENAFNYSSNEVTSKFTEFFKKPYDKTKDAFQKIGK